MSYVLVVLFLTTSGNFSISEVDEPFNSVEECEAFAEEVVPQNEETMVEMFGQWQYMCRESDNPYAQYVTIDGVE